jgi:hypothetical protein
MGGFEAETQLAHACQYSLAISVISHVSFAAYTIKALAETTGAIIRAQPIKGT